MHEITEERDIHRTNSENNKETNRFIPKLVMVLQMYCSEEEAQRREKRRQEEKEKNEENDAIRRLLEHETEKTLLMKPDDIKAIEYLADYEFDSILFDTTICPWSVNHSEFSTNINMLLLLKIYMEISLVCSSEHQ